MIRRKLLFVLVFLTFVACSTPSESAIQTAIAQTQNAEAGVSDTVIQTAIAQTQIAELEQQQVAATQQAQECDITTPYHEDWSIAFCDTFTDNHNGWEIGTGSEELSRSIYSIEDGKLIVDLTGKATSGYTSGVIQWVRILSAKDFVFTVKGNIFSDYKSCTWGVIFNEEDQENLYAFMINSREGYYVLTKYEDGKQSFPISAKSHGAIEWDEQNELTIVAEDGYYQFFINGEYVNELDTPSIRGSMVALAFWTAEGVTARFEFDDLLIKSPEWSKGAGVFQDL